MTEIEFKKYPKTPRLFRDIVVTEKIDGTNAQIYIGEDGEFLTGSRNRWCTPENDHYKFSFWAHTYKDELIEGLGPGRHFGEWWGHGIQRGYGCQYGEQYFSLINGGRWCTSKEYQRNRPTMDPRIEKLQDIIPNIEGLSVVPILEWLIPFDLDEIRDLLKTLKQHGSFAANKFNDPEGLVIWHQYSNTLFKYTFDDLPKGLQKRS